jgi:hypothetical protein
MSRFATLRIAVSLSRACCLDIMMNQFYIFHEPESSLESFSCMIYRQIHSPHGLRFTPQEPFAANFLIEKPE